MDRVAPQTVSHARLGPAALIAALMALALLGSIGVTSAESKTRQFRTGVSYVYIEDAADPSAFQHVREAGATKVLTPLEWGRVVPENRPANWDPENPLDPNYNWAGYDRWVIGAVNAGLTPVLQVRGAPKWANRCGFIAIDTPCNMNPDDLYDFAIAAAKRYSGAIPGLPKVSFWQGPNEANLSLFFEPQYVNGQAVSAELYRTLINTFYAAVKAVDPANIVILGGLGPIAVPKFTIGPMQFTRELLCMRGRVKFRPAKGNCGGGVNFDIFDIHPYTTGSPAHEGGKNDVQLGDLDKLQSLIQAADRANRINSRYKQTPLWVTELSWDSSPPDPGGLPPRILNRWTAEAMHQAWKAGVTDFFWFSLRDFAPDPNVQAYESPESGLYFRGPTVAQDQPKPQLPVFRFPFTAYQNRKGTLSFWGRTPASTGGRVVIQVKSRSGWKKVAVTRAGKGGVFVGKAKTRYGTNRKGFARAHYKKQSSVPFSMKPIGDFRHAPFGDPVH
jgi:hypothetical protein